MQLRDALNTLVSPIEPYLNRLRLVHYADLVRTQNGTVKCSTPYE